MPRRPQHIHAALRVAIAIALATTALAIQGCGEEKTPTVCLRADATHSSQNSVAIHVRDAKTAINYVADSEGHLLFDFITADSRSPVWVKQHRFQADDSTSGSEAATDRDLRRQADDIGDNVTNAIQNQGTQGETDVLGAIGSCANELAQSRDSGPRKIVLLSDLLDSRFHDLNAQSMNKLLGELRRDGDIPELHGAAVYFDTASLEGRDGLSQAQLNAVEHFYRELVRLGHGTTALYSALLRLP